MKLSKIFFGLLCLSSLVTSCNLSYEAPPLDEPVYNGKQANVTIAELKQRFSSVTDAKPDTIKEELVLKAFINSSDEGGNIYKTIYIQDSTAAIAFLVDIGGTTSLYPIGQEVFVDLKGLVVTSYGDQLQIGYPGAYLNRTPWEMFQKHVKRNGWANAENVKPMEVSDLSTLNENVLKNTFRLIKLNNVTFTEGGEKAFAEPNGFGQRELKDEKGNTIVVRTSNYAKFAKELLPKGKGTIIGVLGRFRTSWQILIRTLEDVQGFEVNTTPSPLPTPTPTPQPDPIPTPTPVPTPQPKGEVIFVEEFGTSVSKNEKGFWPSVDVYNGWTNAGKLTFKDLAMTGSYSNASVRVTGTLTSPHLWLAAKKEVNLEISGFSTTAYKTITLSYDIAYNGDQKVNQDVIEWKAGETILSVPSKELEKANVFSTVTITDIPAGFDKLYIISKADKNISGIRIDNVKLMGYK